MSQVSSMACSDPAAEEVIPREEDEWRNQTGKEAVGETALHPCPCQPGYDVLLWGAAGCSPLRAEGAEPPGLLQVTGVHLRSLESLGRVT